MITGQQNTQSEDKLDYKVICRNDYELTIWFVEGFLFYAQSRRLPIILPNIHPLLSKQHPTIRFFWGFMISSLRLIFPGLYLIWSKVRSAPHDTSTWKTPCNKTTREKKTIIEAESALAYEKFQNPRFPCPCAEDLAIQVTTVLSHDFQLRDFPFKL